MNAVLPKVLLVEDSPFEAQLLRRYIGKMGLEIMGPVATAAEALQLCTPDALPSLAILDVKLTGSMDGVELAHQLQLQGAVPIIFVSAADNLETLMRVREANPLAFLPKPYSITGMRRVIELGLYGQTSTPVDWAQKTEEIQEVVLLPQVPWLFVRERGLLVRIATEDIQCVQMEQKYCVITLISGRRHSVRTPLAQLLIHLGDTYFAQVHRSWLVHLKHIESVDLAASIIKLPLPLAAQVPLGRSYREQLIARLQLLD